MSVCFRAISLRGIAAAAGLVALAVIPASAAAQLESTTLSLSTQSVSLDAPTSASYEAGFTSAGSVTYTATTTRSTNTTTRIVISAASNVAGLQWAAAPGGPWTTVTAAEATAHTGTLGLLTPSFSGTIYFRMPLGWTTDAPGSQSVNNIEIRLRQP